MPNKQPPREDDAPKPRFIDGADIHDDLDDDLPPYAAGDELLDDSDFADSDDDDLDDDAYDGAGRRKN